MCSVFLLSCRVDVSWTLHFISSDRIKRLGPHRLSCKLLTAQNPDELLLLWYFKKSWNLSVFMFVSAHVMNYWAVSKKIRAIDLSEHVIDAWFKLITDSNHRAVCVCVCVLWGPAHTNTFFLKQSFFCVFQPLVHKRLCNLRRRLNEQKLWCLNRWWNSDLGADF